MARPPRPVAAASSWIRASRSSRSRRRARCGRARRHRRSARPARELACGTQPWPARRAPGRRRWRSVRPRLRIEQGADVDRVRRVRRSIVQGRASPLASGSCTWRPAKVISHRPSTRRNSLSCRGGERPVRSGPVRTAAPTPAAPSRSCMRQRGVEVGLGGRRGRRARRPARRGGGRRRRGRRRSRRRRRGCRRGGSSSFVGPPALVGRADGGEDHGRDGERLQPGPHGDVAAR